MTGAQLQAVLITASICLMLAAWAWAAAWADRAADRAAAARELRRTREVELELARERARAAHDVPDAPDGPDDRRNRP